MLLQHHRIQALVSIVLLLLVGFRSLHLKHPLVRGVNRCSYFSRYFSSNSDSDNITMDSDDLVQPTPTTDIANDDIDSVADIDNRIMLESELILGRTNRNEVFTADELISLQKSFHNLASLANIELDYDQLTNFAKRVAHLSFKQSFSRTEEAARDLKMILPMPETDPFKQMFHRVLTDGGWDRALQYASDRSQLSNEETTFSPSSLEVEVAMKNKKKMKNNKPWAVLVTGLNGIRKTTSINAPWFRTILYEALSSQLIHTDITIDDLPTGNNSFFRQLDFIVATIANSEFKRLYRLHDVKSYATLKNAIFARYRNLAEICGMLLIDTARDSSMNVLIESSGRDIAMYDYMNYCFPSDRYHRLVVHFTIDDIRFAEKSVDRRMIAEMEAGRRSIRGDNDNEDADGCDDDGVTRRGSGGGVIAQIAANAGGPYGSSQLRSVQSDSDKVASLIFSSSDDSSDDSSSSVVNVARGWFKANISITACDQGPWTIQANSEGSSSSSQVFSFPESL